MLVPDNVSVASPARSGGESRCMGTERMSAERVATRTHYVCASGIADPTTAAACSAALADTFAGHPTHLAVIGIQISARRLVPGRPASARPNPLYPSLVGLPGLLATIEPPVIAALHYNPSRSSRESLVD